MELLFWNQELMTNLKFWNYECVLTFKTRKTGGLLLEHLLYVKSSGWALDYIESFKPCPIGRRFYILEETKVKKI